METFDLEGEQVNDVVVYDLKDHIQHTTFNGLIKLALEDWRNHLHAIKRDIFYVNELLFTVEDGIASVYQEIHTLRDDINWCRATRIRLVNNLPKLHENGRLVGYSEKLSCGVKQIELDYLLKHNYIELVMKWNN